MASFDGRRPPPRPFGPILRFRAAIPAPRLLVRRDKKTRPSVGSAASERRGRGLPPRLGTCVSGYRVQRDPLRLSSAGGWAHRPEEQVELRPLRRVHLSGFSLISPDLRHDAAVAGMRRRHGYFPSSSPIRDRHRPPRLEPGHSLGADPRPAPEQRLEIRAIGDPVAAKAAFEPVVGDAAVDRLGHERAAHRIPHLQHQGGIARPGPNQARPTSSW